MKKLIYFYASSLLLLSIAGCADLDEIPEGSTITAEQKKEVSEQDPSRLQADVNGLYSALLEYGAIYDWYGSVAHFDFGYAAACMMLDASGMDSPSENTGYNWFRNSMAMVDRTAQHSITYFYWNLFYKHMKTANDLIAIIDVDTDDPILKGYLGQALASRAWDYLHLVQIYQYTYKGHESSPAVPIVTHLTTTEEIANNPRASVQEVYDLIISDLTQAIELLEGFSRSGKEAINQNVAYGLRARAYLNMEEWTKAAADADRALQGYTPYSIADVSKPTFNNISASSWIWGIAVSEVNDIVRSGLLNFPSHMCSFTGNGYAPGYAGRYINSALWQTIPETDVRKGWWIDENFYSPHVDYTWTAFYNGVEYGVVAWFGFQAPYLNVKFGPYQDVYDNPTNACDFPMMRAEEMILIKAEALGMSGGDGKSVLESFVRTYRDPAYVCSASSGTAFQDEVWKQRRIELWGEGFSFFDMKRLKKPFNRKGANYPAAFAFSEPAEAPILLWLIPEDEVEVNNGISDGDNNPVVPVPTP